MAIKGHPFNIKNSRYVPMYGMAKAKDISLVDTDEHDPSLYTQPFRTLRNALQQPVAPLLHLWAPPRSPAITPTACSPQAPRAPGPYTRGSLFASRSFAWYM